MNKLILFASSKMSEGGLLVIKNLINSDHPMTIFLNHEYKNRFNAKEHKIYYVRSGFFNLIPNYLFYKKKIGNDATLLGINNSLPIFFKRSIVKKIFLQNRLIIDNEYDGYLNFKEFLRIIILRLKFRFQLRFVDEVIVQTNAMKHQFRKRFNHHICHSYFFRLNLNDEISYQKKSIDLLYVASGESHKNHKNLLEALKELACDNFFPRVCLTVSSQSHMHTYKLIMFYKKQYNLNIINYEKLPHKEVMQLYSKSKALIYPSFCESFGLPLLEASSLRVPIIAAKKDYVSEVVSPDETFDPTSSFSIKKAIQRFFKQGSEGENTLSTSNFLERINDEI